MNNIKETQDSAILLLKNEGALTLKELAEKQEITTEGARFQLQKLAAEGLVKSESKSKGRGRPQQIWSLTQKGHQQFPDIHPGLTVKLIEKIKQNLGEEALLNIIMATGEDNLKKYKQEIGEQDTLEEKVKKLVAIRESEGYMASYVKEDDNSFMLIENHCPICEAAKSCQGFCKAELNVFQNVLGEEVALERINHILAGARRCAYTIKKN